MSSERGQVLVLFAVIFSAIVVMLAYAVDQGFWYGRRRVVQKDSDLAVRAGALGFLGIIADGAAAELSAAESAALRAAVENGAPADNVAVSSSASSCTDRTGATISAPSIEVIVDTEVPRLFSGMPLIEGAGDSIDIGARAVACAGSVQILQIGGSDDPDDDENTMKAMPIVLRTDVTGPRSCFNGGGALVLGRECVVWDALTTTSSSPSTNDRRTLFSEPPDDRCYRSASPDPGDMDHDIAMTCTITTSGTNCPSGTVRTTSCVRTETVDDDDEGSQEDVFDSVDDRLDDATHCSGPDSASFAAAFEDADGRQSAESDHAPPVFPGGQSSSRQRVYVQNNCFDNPRIVMLPIVTGGSDGSNGRRVRGFATVYLTGCYVKSQPVTEPNPSAQNKDCDDFDDDPEDCNDPDDRTDGCDYEIRGVPIHLYVSDGSLGGMTAPRTSAPVTIQVVE